MSIDSISSGCGREKGGAAIREALAIGQIQRKRTESGDTQLKPRIEKPIRRLLKASCVEEWAGAEPKESVPVKSFLQIPVCQEK